MYWSGCFLSRSQKCGWYIGKIKHLKYCENKRRRKKSIQNFKTNATQLQIFVIYKLIQNKNLTRNSAVSLNSVIFEMKIKHFISVVFCFIFSITTSQLVGIQFSCFSFPSRLITKCVRALKINRNWINFEVFFFEYVSLLLVVFQ